MNEIDLQNVFNNPIYPKNSKIHSDKRFVNIDNGSKGGFHWTAFYTKDNKSFSIVLVTNLISFYLFI